MRALWHLAAGEAKSLEAAAQAQLPQLDFNAHARLQSLIERRKNGTPLAHLTGRQRFMGIDMLAGPQALIPRVETELLGYAALRVLDTMPTSRPLKVLDLCTGSGNVALAIAKHNGDAEIFASDLSADAISFAQCNAKHLGLEGRVDWRIGDLLAPFPLAQFRSQFDLITCNPPYISSPKLASMPSEIAAHEPELAFNGGPLGIRILQRLIREAGSYLAPDGALAFEVGHGQGPAVLRRLDSLAAFSQTTSVPDASGEIRVIIARARAAAINNQ
ncbi:MAG: release factor glutamine methyltransferase [Pseudomonadota bacterium]